MPTKPTIDFKSPKKRIEKLEQDVDVAELAEDARFLVDIYRQMVIEEDRARRRASILKHSIENAELNLKRIECRCVRKQREAQRLHEQFKDVRQELRDAIKVQGVESVVTSLELEASGLRRWIGTAREREKLIESVDRLKKERVTLNKIIEPLREEVASLKSHKDFWAGEVRNAKVEIDQIKASRTKAFYEWNGIFEVAKGKHLTLAKHIEETINDLYASVGRMPKLVLVNPATFTGLTRHKFQDVIASIGHIRLEVANFVKPNKAILRF